MTDSEVLVRRMNSGDVEAIVAAGRALKGWFTDGGVRDMGIDAANNLGVVAESAGALVGFLTWYSYNGIGRVSWAGVLTDHHRKGIGRRLLHEAESHMRTSGVRELRVETLGDSVDYEPYARTRAFYRAVGFTDFKREMTDNPECPELLTLSKSLRPGTETP